MKYLWKIFVMVLLTAFLSAGCGAAENGEDRAASQTSVENEAAEAPAAEESGTEETSETEENGTAEAADASASEESETLGKQAADLTPDPTNLTYLEEVQIADFYGDGKEYPLYAPKGGENEDGFFYYSDHGVRFTVFVYNCGYPEYAAEFLQMYLEDSAKSSAKDWQENYECSDVGVGEVLEKGDDRYLFLTAKKKDYDGAVYQKKMLVYMSVREGGAGVFWDMELTEIEQDEETAALVAEVARCYGLDLSELSMEDGTWAEQKAQYETDSQDVYEPREGDPVLEKVEGYQYLGMLTITINEEENVTCPVLAPMGRGTDAAADRVSTSMHGVSVTVHGEHIDAEMNYKTLAQRSANSDFRIYSEWEQEQEQEYRNVRVSEVMPMQGQEAGVYYALEYEEKESKTEEYQKRVNVTCYIQVKEKHFVICDISLRNWKYDSKTNSLIKELESAYGLDLSEWYADEEALQTTE